MHAIPVQVIVELDDMTKRFPFQVGELWQDTAVQHSTGHLCLRTQSLPASTLLAQHAPKPSKALLLSAQSLIRPQALVCLAGAELLCAHSARVQCD